MKATRQGQVVAESGATVVVESNHYVGRPKPEAANKKGRIAFWKDVKVS